MLFRSNIMLTEAAECLDTLRKFVSSVDGVPDRLFRALETIDDFVLNHRSATVVQSKLTAFFQKRKN